MSYGHMLKLHSIRLGLPGARPGAGSSGPMINPRAPLTRVGLMMGGARNFGTGFPAFHTMRGDPGLFGAIAKAVSGAAHAVGSVVKGVGKVASAVVHNPLVSTALNMTPVGMAVNAGVGVLDRIGAPASRNSIGLPMAQPPAPGNNFSLPNIGPGPIPDTLGPDPDMDTVPAQNTAVVTTPSGHTALVPTQANVCTMKGYHLNKSAYWSNGSQFIPGAHYVAKGTVCVKNRRMNPFNPRAASRAMSRLSSLSKGMKVLDKMMRKLARGAGHRPAPVHHRRRKS